MAVFTFTTIFGRLGAGFLADIYDKRKVVALATIVIAAGLPILAIADQIWHVIIALVIIAVGFGATLPVRRPLWPSTSDR